MSLIRGMELQKMELPKEFKPQGKAPYTKSAAGDAKQTGAANNTETAYKAEISEEGRSRLNQAELQPSPNEDLRNQARLSIIMWGRMEHMKLTDRLDGKEEASDLEYLTRSYDAMVSKPNNYFDILGKYSNVSGKKAFYNVIDTAFESVAKKILQDEAEKTISNLGLDKATAEGAYEANKLIKNANKEAELFSSSFLSAYKNGDEKAFESAIDKLNDMRETDHSSSEE